MLEERTSLQSIDGRKEEGGRVIELGIEGEVGAERMLRAGLSGAGLRQSWGVILVVYSRFKLIKGQVGDLSQTKTEQLVLLLLRRRLSNRLVGVSSAWIVDEGHIEEQPTLCRDRKG